MKTKAPTSPMDIVVACDRCGKSDTMDPSWHWAGERWEHKCMLPGDFSQAGHIGIGVEMEAER